LFIEVLAVCVKIFVVLKVGVETCKVAVVLKVGVETCKVAVVLKVGVEACKVADNVSNAKLFVFW